MAELGTEIWTNLKNGRDYVLLGVAIDANNYNARVKPQYLYRCIEDGAMYFRDPQEFSIKFKRGPAKFQGGPDVPGQTDSHFRSK